MTIEKEDRKKVTTETYSNLIVKGRGHVVTDCFLTKML